MVPPPRIAVAAFYKFHPLADLERVRGELLALCRGHDALGIVIIAPEGVNATISVLDERLPSIMAGIGAATGIAGLSPRVSFAAAPPFKRMKIRIKPEIVTLGRPDADPNASGGRYVEPAEWNAVVADPDVVVIDARNAYEIGFGTFRGSIDPGTRSFRAFPDWVKANLDPDRHRRIAMFCTGGIRCEKASSYMLAAGFREVVQLRGGILNYLEKQPEAESLWRGGCFVFDERVAVGHGLKPLDLKLCLSCNAAIDSAAMAAEGYEEGVSCPRCVGLLTPEQKSSARERQRQLNLARSRRQRR